MFKSALIVMKNWPWLPGRPSKVGVVEVPYHGVLNDAQIRQLAETQNFISPFVPENVKTVPLAWPAKQVGDESDEIRRSSTVSVPSLSYGTSSFGYDFTLSDEIYLFNADYRDVIDVKAFDLDKYTERLTAQSDQNGMYVILPPHSFVLGHTIEYVRMPDDLVGICFDKSSYARIGGIQTNVTPIEPGWHGQITLEIRNTLPSFTRLYVGEGIIQTLFLRGMRPDVTYADKQGKYQGQQGVTGAKV